MPVEGALNGDEPSPRDNALPGEPNGHGPAETPAVAETPAEPEQPSPAETPAVAETPAEPEQPAPAETAVAETPAEPEQPSPAETPAVAETPAELEQASPAETPAVAETPAELEQAVSAETPAVAETPSTEEAPAEISSALAAEIEEALQAAREPEPEAAELEPAVTAAEAPAARTVDVAEAVAEEEGEEEPVSREFLPGDWFVVHTYAGYENKVKTNLESRITSMNMEDRIFEVVIPMEDVMEIKSGKKQVVQRKVFPGYLLVRMDLDDHSWSAVRNTPGVTGFVGSGTKPIPLSEKEVDRILQRKPVERPKPRLEWALNDPVRVTTGPFANFQGMISEIDTDRSKLKVLVNIFGRETPVELGFDQVAKV